jgi:hypothetical protein
MKNTNNYTLLKSLLALQTVAILVYTALSVRNEGWDLFTIFVNNLTSLTWNGQFNLDFSSYLLLSGLWILWRNKFSPASLLIGGVATILGILFFAPYLLYLLYVENGDLRKVLVGDR